MARLEKIRELTMTSFFASDLEKANEALDLQSTLVRDLHQLAASIGNDHRESKRSSSSNALSLVLRPHRACVEVLCHDRPGAEQSGPRNALAPAGLRARGRGAYR